MGCYIEVKVPSGGGHDGRAFWVDQLANEFLLPSTEQ
jgi:hypothetical protein